MKRLTLFVLAMTLVACATRPKESIKVVEKPAPEHLSVGLKQLEDKNYEEALAEFEAVLLNQTTSAEVPMALFYSGVALQELQRYPDAIERFRKFTSGMIPAGGQYTAKAFHRLGLCYEATGEKGTAIAAYIDAINHLASEKSPVRVELQARLAGLYAQLGNEDEAQKFYDSAEKELLSLRRQQLGKELPPWMPETLFNMGKMSLKPLSASDYEGSLRSFEKGQIWLLRVARLNDKKWSELAVEELTKIYTDAWAMIEAVPLMEDTDRILALKDQQDQKITMGASLYKVLSKLKVERGYDYTAENKFEKRVFQNLTAVENHLEALLKTRPIEQDLTPAAKEREGLKRRGRLIDIKEDSSKKKRN